MAIESPEDEKKEQKKKDQKDQGIDDKVIDQSVGEPEPESTAPLAKMKKKMKKTSGGKDDSDAPLNEELKALVAHMYSLSKQSKII